MTKAGSVWSTPTKVGVCPLEFNYERAYTGNKLVNQNRGFPAVAVA